MVQVGRRHLKQICVKVFAAKAGLRLCHRRFQQLRRTYPCSAAEICKLSCVNPQHILDGQKPHFASFRKVSA